MNEFSYGKEAAEFTMEFLRQNIDAIHSSTKSIFKLAKRTLQLRLERTYKAYFEEVGKKYSKVRTFLINQEDVDLYEFYVPLGVTMNRTKYPDVMISELTLTRSFHVVTGSAGKGKSMTMRHLFLDSIRHRERVPIFIELRKLNEGDISLVDLLNKTLEENHFDLGPEYFNEALTLGHFILFLDGFDEIADEKRDGVQSEILQITKRFDRNQVVVSSRPDDCFNAWTGFRVWTVDDLSIEKACQLIEKLPFDADVKIKFIDDLREKLFEEHKYFLSNPLLLTIMWLCYRENAAIPKRLSLFYQQAYEALFNKHDAKKGAYERDRRTSLDVKEFADVFSAFAIQTFDENKVEFSEADAIGHLNNAKDMKRLKFSSADFLKDSIKSVCLILEDGLKLRFSHRSFQEYFAAYFVVNSNEDVQRKLLSRYIGRHFASSNIVEMVNSIKPEIVEQFLIIPEVELMEKRIGYNGKITEEVFVKFIKEMFRGFLPRGKEGSIPARVAFMIKSTKLLNLSRLVSAYPEVKSVTNTLRSQIQASQAELIKALDKAINNKKGSIIIPVDVALKENAFRKALMKSGHTFHLEALITAKTLLQEKHKNQNESLADILRV